MKHKIRLFISVWVLVVFCLSCLGLSASADAVEEAGNDDPGIAEEGMLPEDEIPPESEPAAEPEAMPSPGQGQEQPTGEVPEQETIINDEHVPDNHEEDLPESADGAENADPESIPEETAAGEDLSEPETIAETEETPDQPESPADEIIQETVEEEIQYTIVPAMAVNYPALSAKTAVRSTGNAVGATITWTITPSGGNGDYAYFYNIFCGDEGVKYGDWQLNPSISWTTTKAGNYFVAAYVVDSRWTEIAQSPDGGLVTVAPAFSPLRGSLAVNKTTANVGDTISWTLTPSGGNGDYAYFYNIFCGDEVVKYGDWQLSPTISWTPTKGGNYFVAGYVVDSRWTEISQAPEGGLCSVNSAVTGVYVNADKTSVNSGDLVTWTAGASGGNGLYLYNFAIYNGTEYKGESGWQAENTFSAYLITPGSVSCVVSVTDTTWSSTATGKQKTPTKVKKTALSIPDENTYIDTTEPVTGEEIYLDAWAVGGTGVYTYQYTCWEYDEDDNSYAYSWNTDWSEDGSCSISFSGECTILVECEVMDSDGASFIYAFPIIHCTDLSKSVQIILRTGLPKSISYYSGSRLTSMCTVTEFEYTYEYYSYSKTCSVKLYFKGKKTYDSNGSGQSASAKIGWKLYDSEGIVVEDGTYFSSSVNVGESFGGKSNYGYASDLAPGKYYLELVNVN